MGSYFNTRGNARIPEGMPPDIRTTALYKYLSEKLCERLSLSNKFLIILKKYKNQRKLKEVEIPANIKNAKNHAFKKIEEFMNLLITAGTNNAVVFLLSNKIKYKKFIELYSALSNDLKPNIKLKNKNDVRRLTDIITQVRKRDPAFAGILDAHFSRIIVNYKQPGIKKDQENLYRKAITILANMPELKDDAAIKEILDNKDDAPSVKFIKIILCLIKKYGDGVKKTLNKLLALLDDNAKFSMALTIMHAFPDAQQQLPDRGSIRAFLNLKQMLIQRFFNRDISSTVIEIQPRESSDTETATSNNVQKVIEFSRIIFSLKKFKMYRNYILTKLQEIHKNPAHPLHRQLQRFLSSDYLMFNYLSPTETGTQDKLFKLAEAIILITLVKEINALPPKNLTNEQIAGLIQSLQQLLQVQMLTLSPISMAIIHQYIQGVMGFVALNTPDSLKQLLKDIKVEISKRNLERAVRESLDALGRIASIVRSE